MRTARALLTLQFKCDDSPIPNNIAKLELGINPDELLAGEVTTYMYPDQGMFAPSYVLPEPEYKNKSNKLIIHNSNQDNKISFLVHPQTIRYMKCTAYDNNDSQIFQIEHSISLEIRKGSKVNATFTVVE